MWWHHISGDNEGRISKILRLYPITVEYILLNVKLVALKRKNYDPILTVERIERRKFVDYFGRSIEAYPSRVGKKNIYFFHIGYIPRPSSIKLHISSHHLDKDFNL